MSARSDGARTRRGSERRRAGAIHQLPRRQIINRYPRLAIVSEDEIEALHQASLRLLSEVGVKCYLPEARSILNRAGALVDDATMRVRLGRELVEHALTTVPPVIELVPRNPQNSTLIGGDNVAFATVLGPPNCSDIERGRRSGTLADHDDFLRLAQFFNIIQLIGGSPVEPLDIEVRFRHLEATRSMLTLTDKVPYVFCLSRQRIHDVFEMCAIARGEDLEQFARRPGVFSIINTNSPLQYDLAMATGVIEMARFGQPTLITPFIMAGATAPATVAAGMAMNNAEILFGVTLAQLVRPGAPVLYGNAAKNVDLKTGAPAYGLAESYRFTHIGGQLARRYRMPLRSSAFCASNLPDAAAMLEGVGAIWAAITAGANLLMHGAGWLEGGLCSSFEKFVLDVEVLQNMAVWLKPVTIDAETLALDEIAEVGPGGHFFGTARTIATFETAFHQPIISTTQNYGAWLEAGGLDATRRAHRLYRQALAEYEPPAIADDIREALDAFVARRTGEGGAPLD
ncbi:MAG TPA: trimethylamine methyltransferase family protein [Aestuariivirgaceae bacterium]|jgi:trimethylamine---corrinoid protein Co-methyltransferase|nr:trimethylamine methyltransferase family protein [Aestuariivirgaceae bacterium]